MVNLRHPGAWRKVVLGALAIIVVAGALVVLTLADNRARNSELAEFRAIAARFEPPQGFESISSIEQRAGLCNTLHVFWGCPSTAVTREFRADEAIAPPCAELVDLVGAFVTDVERGSHCDVEGAVDGAWVRAVVTDSDGYLVRTGTTSKDRYRLSFFVRPDNR